MTAETLTKALGGRWHGSYGTARCPAHKDKTPSLSVRDADGEKLLTYCHAGCSAEAVWDALTDRNLVGVGRRQSGVLHQHARLKAAFPDSGIADRQKAARKIWQASQPAENTLAQDYLRGRGIIGPVPPTIRYHPGLKHADTGLNMPCLVAAVADIDSHVTGIQRIFLTLNGRKTPLNRPKMALGTLRGNAVRLAPTTDRVWLTEGIEDGLALMQMMGEPAWAVLGTGNYKTVDLPENIRQVILAPDGDDAGQGIIQEAAIRLAGQGREVRAAKLPTGKDWCDVLDDVEERVGILEFDFEIYRNEAEALARREAINE